MPSRDINWSYWRTFLAVLQTGSLSAAARSLSLTQPTVGNHIDNLEAALNESLFLRSQEGLTPTPFALSLEPKAREMAMSAHFLKRLAKSESLELEGTVRITASEIVGVEILPPILRSFRVKYPKVRLELVLSNTQDDLLNADADIAVRMVRPKQKRLIAKKIGDVPISLFAHESYLEGRVAPQTIGELFGHDLIGIDRDIERWTDMSLNGHSIHPDDLSFKCDSDIGQLSALRAGLGIGVCQRAIAKSEPELVEVLPTQIQIALEMWIVMHEDLKAHQSARAVFNHFAKELPV